MGAQGRIRWGTPLGHGRRPLHPALARYGSGGMAMRSGPANAPFVPPTSGMNRSFLPSIELRMRGDIFHLLAVHTISRPPRMKLRYSSPVRIIPSPPVFGFEHLCPSALLAVHRFVDPQFVGKKVFQQP